MPRKKVIKPDDGGVAVAERPGVDARNRPAVPKHELDTSQMDVGQGKERMIVEDSKGHAMVTPIMVDGVDRSLDAEWMAMMAFAAEKVTIVVLETADKTAENPVPYGNNGLSAAGTFGWLYRGREYTMERKFVESLARAKVTTYTQEQRELPGGVKHIVNIPHTACRYPFRMVRDDNPRGTDWLRSIMLEA